MSFPRRLPGLIVSVRSADEAAAALAGGADVIDVKEPASGALGRAPNRTIAAVLDQVAGRRPVSAALGELAEQLPPPDDPRLAFVKWGLAGYGSFAHLAPSGQDSWQSALNKKLSSRGNPQTVIVAYADWQCAKAPEVREVVDFACRRPGSVLLIDTHCKERDTLGKNGLATLLDWLGVEEVTAICAQCHDAGVRVALAGSLGSDQLDSLRSAHPDWFAVRGAVCNDGARHGAIAADRVASLVKKIAS